MIDKQSIQSLLARLFIFFKRQDKNLTYHKLIQQGLLIVGRHTYGVPIIDAYAGSERKVSIGSFCSISRDVVIITGGVHPSEFLSTFPFRAKWKMPGALQDGIPRSNGDVVIGSDVWIGTEAMILSGITIGDGAIVAARSVVTRDVPPYAVVAGAPAKVMRYRFAPEVIERMLQIKWWEWDDARIKSMVPLLSSNRVEDFLKELQKEDS